MRQIISEDEVLIRKIEINNHKIRWIVIDNEIYINGVDLVKANIISSEYNQNIALGPIKTTKRPYLITHRTKGNYKSPMRYIYIGDIIKRIRYSNHIWDYIKKQGVK